MLTQPLLTPRQIRYLVVTALCIAIGLVIYYAATHGRIVVQGGDKEVTLVPITKKGEALASNRVSSGSFVKSATYILRNDREGYSRFAHVSVPGWFQTATIRFDTDQTANLSRTAALTYENFFQGDDQSLISLTDTSDFASGYTVHGRSDAFGTDYTDVAFPRILRNTLITTKGTVLGIDERSTIQSYSFATKTATDLVSVEAGIVPDDHDEDETVVTTPTSRRSSDVSSSRNAFYTPNSHTLHVVDVANGQTSRYSLPLQKTDTAIFDVNDSAYIYINKPATGNKASTSLDDEERTYEFSATITPLETGKAATVELGSAKTISGVALSPSGDYVAVVKDSHLWVYRTETSELVMADLFAPTTQIFWRGIKLYRLTVEQGLGVFDTATKQLVPVKVSGFGTLSYSVATPIGSRIYLSAYNNHENSELADGYVIDLEQKDSGLTTALSKALPYTGRGYDITYLDNTIYIRSKYIPRSANDPYLAQIKTEAVKELSTRVDAAVLKQCTITYLN